MYDQHFSFCRGCGRQIIWTRTCSGKSMPCDPEIIRFRAEEGGGSNFVLPDGRVMRGTPCDNGETTGYTPHWATCPQQGMFRKGGRRGE